MLSESRYPYIYIYIYDLLSESIIYTYAFREQDIYILYK